MINRDIAKPGDKVDKEDKVTFDGRVLTVSRETVTIMLNKPPGYVCSRKGQGNKTIYDLLPKKYQRLKPIGRLDKDSSGLLLLTNDGIFANKLTHPRYQKEKIYVLALNKKLGPRDKNQLLTGVELSDGMSKFINVKHYSNNDYQVVLAEGRNRQIRRTFNALGYKILSLHRIRLGSYQLPDNLLLGEFNII